MPSLWHVEDVISLKHALPVMRRKATSNRFVASYFCPFTFKREIGNEKPESYQLIRTQNSCTDTSHMTLIYQPGASFSFSSSSSSFSPSSTFSSLKFHCYRIRLWCFALLIASLWQCCKPCIRALKKKCKSIASLLLCVFAVNWRSERV